MYNKLSSSIVKVVELEHIRKGSTTQFLQTAQMPLSIRISSHFGRLQFNIILGIRLRIKPATMHTYTHCTRIYVEWNHLNDGCDPIRLWSRHIINVHQKSTMNDGVWWWDVLIWFHAIASLLSSSHKSSHTHEKWRQTKVYRNRIEVDPQHHVYLPHKKCDKLIIYFATRTCGFLRVRQCTKCVSVRLILYCLSFVPAKKSI